MKWMVEEKRKNQKEKILQNEIYFQQKLDVILKTNRVC